MRRSSVSSGSTPPLNSASMIASCSACIVRSSSDSPYMPPNGDRNPLESSRSDSFSIRSSRSRSSSGSPVYFEYLYFTSFQFPASSFEFLVVVLLLPSRQRQSFVHVSFRGAARRPSLRLLGRVIAAVVATADFFLCVETFQDDVDRGRERGLR